MRTYQALFASAIRHVRNRRSVILDATYSRRFLRDQLREKLRRAGIAFFFVEAKASDKRIRQRLKDRTGKNAQVSDARFEDFETLSDSYEPPNELPAPEFVAIASKARPEATITNLLKALADRRAQPDESRVSSKRQTGARSTAK